MYFSPSGGNSWADRVKGIPSSPKTSEVVKETPEKHELHPVLPSPPVLSPVPSSLTESLDSFKEIIGTFCIYSKTCLKWPLKNRQNKGLKDKWLLNEGRKYCRMLCNTFDL